MDSLPDEALDALLEYSIFRESPHDQAYRSGSRIMVSDGCLILRLAVEKPENLGSLTEFPFQSTLDAWKFPIELFRVDVGTLAAWAKNDDLMIVKCPNCEGGTATAVGCGECEGAGKVPGHISYGWLTAKRLVDRRYVEMIVAIAAEADVIDVRAQSHEATAVLRFRAPHWDAYLMPIAVGDVSDDEAKAPPLWTPAPVLEGVHA